MTALHCLICWQPRFSLLHALNQAPCPAKLPDDSSGYLSYARAKDGMLAQKSCLTCPWVLHIACGLQECTCTRYLA